METLIDIQGKCVLGDIKNPRFVVQDVNWGYKVFQMDNYPEFEKEKDILFELDGCSHQCRMESFGYAVRGEKRYCCIKMPWYGRENLDFLIPRLSREELSEKMACALIERMLAPFLELEEKGYRHNDIAPENLIRKEDGNFLLIDYGAAIKIEDILGGNIGGLELRGHAGYNSPEKQNGIVSIFSDIYSFGMLMSKVLERGKELGCKYSDKLFSICFMCKQHEQEKRYKSFREVALAISQLKQQKDPKPMEKAFSPAKGLATKKCPKNQHDRHLRNMLIGAIYALFITSSMSVLTMEIYLTFFRTYGNSPLETAAMEKRSLSNDFKLTFQDLINHINKHIDETVN